MAASGARKSPKSEKLDEAQALARSCAGRPDFLPCDGLSICATHSHGKCFKLHWCCHLGWCHCKFGIFFLYMVLIISSVNPQKSISLARGGGNQMLGIWFLSPPCQESRCSDSVLTKNMENV